MRTAGLVLFLGCSGLIHDCVEADLTDSILGLEHLVTLAIVQPITNEQNKQSESIHFYIQDGIKQGDASK
jgi:hypothetical protein